jgi:hypothetical protein
MIYGAAELADAVVTSTKGPSCRLTGLDEHNLYRPLYQRVYSDEIRADPRIGWRNYRVPEAIMRRQ